MLYITKITAKKMVSRRRQRGSALSEFAPALFILIICAICPVLDLIFDGIGYCACGTLNNLQLREAVRVPKSQATNPQGSVQLTIPNNWRNSAVGMLAPLTTDPVTDVSYDVGAGNAYVTVTTTVSVRPLLPVPFFPNVPGLSAPIVFNVSGQRILENPRFLSY